jgi:NADH dehydrogenase/NADH:ubiquinone oxidoreductase subunit G
MSEIVANQITLKIDDATVSVPVGATLLEAAREAGKEVPTICYHEHCTANGLCRMCVVEVEGARVLSPACVAQAAEGMSVQTRSPRVERSRRTILEMLASSVDLSDAPEIQQMLDEYRVDPQRFPGAIARSHAVLDDNPMYIRDYAKCVLCWRCVQVCAEDAQYTFAINFSQRGYETSIGTFFDKGMMQTTCVFCGQCVGVCPSGALKAKREWLLEGGQPVDEILNQTRAERRRRRGAAQSGSEDQEQL